MGKVDQWGTLRIGWNRSTYKSEWSEELHFISIHRQDARGQKRIFLHHTRQVLEDSGKAELRNFQELTVWSILRFTISHFIVWEFLLSVYIRSYVQIRWHLQEKTALSETLAPNWLQGSDLGSQCGMRLKALQARLFKATIVTKSNIYSKISGHHIRHQTNNPGVGLKYWRVFYVPATDSTKPVIWINFLLDSLDHHLRPAPWEACWYVWNDAPAQPTTLKRLLSSLTELNHIQYYSIHNFPRGAFPPIRIMQPWDTVQETLKDYFDPPNEQNKASKHHLAEVDLWTQIDANKLVLKSCGAVAL